MSIQKSFPKTFILFTYSVVKPECPTNDLPSENLKRTLYETSRSFSIKAFLIKKDSKGSGGKTDGLIECNYKGKFFYGIQETKYKLPDTELQLKKQLVQPMMYDWIFERKGFYYDTSNFFVL